MIKLFGITLIAMLLFAGCGDSGVNSDTGGSGLQLNPNINYGSFTDSRDGQSYRTVRIGNRMWMAENFNYAHPACGISWCYGNSASHCTMYGRLYDWCAAVSACPDGWRLPGDADWYDLIKAAGSQEVAAEKFKSQAGWSDDGNGADEFGFSALPGGYGRSCQRAFIGAGRAGFWWGATEFGAWIMSSDYEGVEASIIGANAGLSVRCVRD